jgi:hypothetical protein
VIDVMRNGGGDGCYTQNLARYLIGQQFHGVANTIRATQYWVEYFSSNLWLTELLGGDQATIDLYTSYLNQIEAAMAANRGMTGPLPICGTTIQVGPMTDKSGNSLAYTKPVLVLADEFTASAAELFGYLLQDAQRATVMGVRTDGAGGNPGSYDATTYSEGTTTATRTLLVRANAVQTPDFPASAYIENTGVYPDVVQDYMTADNLLNKGATFVQAFSNAIAAMMQ